MFMKKYLVRVLLLLCPFLLVAQDDALTAVNIPEIRRTVNILADEIKRLADTQVNTDRQLQANYKAQLAALRKTMQEAGDLENVLAVGEEMRRFDEALTTGGDEFEAIPEMPQTALVETPALLRTAQEGFMRQRQGAVSTRKNAVTTLTQKFISRLEDYQREYTKNGKIDEALAIRGLTGKFRAAVETQSVEGLTQSLLAGPAATQPSVEPTTSTTRAPWRHWKFLKSGSYSPDGMIFDSPELPNDVTLEFTPTLGKGRVTGRSRSLPKTINGQACTRFGKALQWNIGAPQNLNATMTLTSLHTAQPPAGTPALQVRVMSDTTQLANITVPISTSPMTLRLITPQNSTRAAIYCEQAQPASTTIDIPADKPVTLLLGFYMKDAGQSCDTSFVIE